MLTCCTCGCAPTVCWPRGFVGILPVLRPPACSGSASPGGCSSLLWFTPFAMGSPLRGRGYFVLDRNEGLVCFFLSLWGVSSCCHCPSGWGHHMGQGLVWRARRWLWCCALSPYGWASNLCLRLLFAPCPTGEFPGGPR